ncbi:MAG: metallo-mystery pair system four-Cys motif protein [Leptospira sp.]|nr:metallo-mystery pair system four-Cys motif protein [Leptospira sp.]
MNFFKIIKNTSYCFLIILLTIGCNPFAKSEDNNNDDILLGLALLSQQSSGLRQGSLNFDAKFDGKSIECGSTTYTMPDDQVVQMRDFRFFIQDVQFVRSNGEKIAMQMNQVDDWQLRDGNDQVALLDFTVVNQGKCVGTSDDINVRKQIDGLIPIGNFDSVEITIGVPNKWNHVNFNLQPSNSPLRGATGLTWSWLAGYKFIRLELTINTTNMQFHLGSTNCTGDISIPQGQDGSVTCANPYRPNLILKPDGGFNPATDTITISLDEFFRGNGGVPTSAYDDGTALSCMPIGNGSGSGGTSTTCGPILKNLGLVPGNNAGFGSGTNNETGVGTVNLETQQSILRLIR